MQLCKSYGTHQSHIYLFVLDTAFQNVSNELVFRDQKEYVAQSSKALRTTAVPHYSSPRQLILKKKVALNNNVLTARKW